MFSAKLRPPTDAASIPCLRLPRRYSASSIERITVTDDGHPKYRAERVHLTVEDSVATIRVLVTTEPHLRAWNSQRRRSFARHVDSYGQPLGFLAEQLGVLHYVLTPDMLRGVNAHIDCAFFHRETERRPRANRLSGYADRELPVYGLGRFTWVPPEGPFDFRSRAYRDIAKSEVVPDARHLGPVETVNLLLGPPLYIRRATVEVTFR